MANKRQLKKYVRQMCGAIAGESLLAAESVPGADATQLTKVLLAAADLQGASLELISFGFDKGARDFADRRAYRKARRDYFKSAYAKFTEEFGKHATDLLADLNSSLPAEAKAAKVEKK